MIKFEDMICPVCSHTNKREYHINHDSGLIEEDYYNCSYCGYWEGRSYSPIYSGIEILPKNKLRQIFLLIKNLRRVKLNFPFHNFGFSVCPYGRVKYEEDK